MKDQYDLSRFLKAQEGIYDRALEELQAGAKRSHWMWFIFPQIKGLGHSAMAERYAIGSLDEARAFLGHDVLGPRLRTATETVIALHPRTLGAIFGSPDDRKFGSSMTLFSYADRQAGGLFRQALALFCDGKEDAATSTRLH